MLLPSYPLILSILFSCLTLCPSVANGARILAVFPSLFYSHHQVYQSYIDEFLNQGHEVVIITTWPQYSKGQVPTNLTQINIHDVSIRTWNKEMPKIYEDNANDTVDLSAKTLELIVALSEIQFQMDEVKNIINNKDTKFDLLITETYVIMKLVSLYFNELPVVEISTLGAAYGDLENIGAPVQPLLYPQTMRRRLNNLTLWEEIREVYNDIRIKKVLHESLNVYTTEARKNASADILYNNVDMLYLNTHPVWEGIRPIPLSVIYTYGIHEKPCKELPEDLLTYLEGSVNGVIYVSFGTTANTDLYSGQLKILMNAFSKLPYDVLFKWHEGELDGIPDNVKIAKWFPQADLLKHSKVKAFITQGGVQSTDEAINAGVPLIGIPLIWDQWSNVERYVRHGIGIKLEMDDITEEQVIKAVNTVISDDSYRTNIIKLRTILMDSPQRPSERVVRWTQYMLRHGGARHLRAPAANMSHAEFFEIELFLILFTILFISCSILYRCLCLLFEKYLKLLNSHRLIRFKSKYVTVF